MEHTDISMKIEVNPENEEIHSVYISYPFGEEIPVIEVMINTYDRWMGYSANSERIYFYKDDDKRFAEPHECGEVTLIPETDLERSIMGQCFRLESQEKDQLSIYFVRTLAVDLKKDKIVSTWRKETA